MQEAWLASKSERARSGAMDFSEEVARLETTDIAHSQRLIQKWRSDLESMHNPELLSSLLEHHLLTQSRPALKVLLGVKENHSQAFFDKTNSCLMRRTTCLAALRLLADLLNGQVTWLYKIVQHPIFQTLLQILKLMDDLLVLTRAVFVMTVLLPLDPHRVTTHLPDLYEAFTHVATLKSNKQMENTPAELFLVLDVAAYYLFLQLYSLFPCGFVQYLKGRFGPTGEVALYQEHIAPLFSHVQLHPSLVTEIPQQETRKSKWSSWEPHDLATYSLSLSLDPFLVPLDDSSPADRLQECRNVCNTTTHPPLLTVSIPSDPKMCGLVSTEELADMWTPSLAFGQLGSGEVSRTSSRMTSVSSPFQDTSQQHTPVPSVSQPTFKYSPTASVEVDRSAVRGLQDSPAHSGTSSPIRPYNSQSCPPSAKSSFRTRLANMFGRWSQKEPAPEAAAVGENFSQSEEFHREKDKTKEQEFLRSLQLPLDPPAYASRQSSSSSDEWPSQELVSLHERTSTLTRASFSTDDTITSSLLLAQEKLQELAECEEADRSTPQVDEEGKDRTPLAAHNLPHKTAVPVGSNKLPTLPAEELPSCLLSRSVLSSKRQRCTNSSISSVSSPAAILEQYVNCGVLIHSGQGAIPLADLEGIDWNHYGGCPHSEELGIMTAYVSMLQSQVMFERYQCQQHSRRNRRLLSKARTASKLENEIVTLRDQLHQQNHHINVLEQELELSKGNATSMTDSLVRENTALRTSNRVLREDVACYQKQVNELTGVVEHLQKELNETNKQVFNLAIEKETTQERLREADQLESEMGQLLQEHLVLEEVYQQQQASLAALRLENTKTQQLTLLSNAVTKEKEDLEGVVSGLRLHVDKLSAELQEQNQLMQSREKEIAYLKSSHELLQSRSSERIRSVEDKYHAVKVLNQKLESAILSLHGRTGVSHTNS